MLLGVVLWASTWPMLGHDPANSGLQPMSGDLSASNYSVLWRTPSLTLSRIAGAAIYDIRGDVSGSEVLFVDDQYLRCLRGTDGSEIWSADIGTDINPQSSPAVGDVDGDGVMEIVVGRTNGTLYCVDAYGNLEWTFDVGAQIMASPTLYDLSGDGNPEIIFGQMFLDTVWALSATPTGPTVFWMSDLGYGSGGISATSASITNAVSVGDVDGDGSPEVVVPLQITTLDVLGTYPTLVVLDGATGSVETEIETWNMLSEGTTITLASPGIGDVNGDGKADIIAGIIPSSAPCLVKAYSVSGGSATTLWTYNIPMHGDTALTTYFEAIVAFDVDGDGRVEAFFGDGGDSMNLASHLTGLDHDGTPLFEYDISNWAYDGGGAICDIDMDGSFEFIKTADDGYVYILDAIAGTMEWRYDAYDEAGDEDTCTDAAVAVGDVDGDGCSEIVVVSDMAITALNGPNSNCTVGVETGEDGKPIPTLLAKGEPGALLLSVEWGTYRVAVVDPAGRTVAKLTLSAGKWARVELWPGVYFIKSTDGRLRGKAVVR